MNTIKIHLSIWGLICGLEFTTLKLSTLRNPRGFVGKKDLMFVDLFQGIKPKPSSTGTDLIFYIPKDLILQFIPYLRQQQNNLL